ncbi:hypothetical protein PINS_up006256 [Pythium insidiosum]|nr:hypothetical protein PINS_up006256 [Pythium insidiosum]
MAEAQYEKPPSPLRASTQKLVQSVKMLGSIRQMKSTTAATSPTRSGRSSPLPEMSVTEQIARKTRKSTVLDEKNALLILAIPDYDDYKVMQPYSCRSLSNKSRFVGGKDFITRHNPQEVNDFKMQYSRDVGNLNRHRSIMTPPNALLTPVGAAESGRSFSFLASQSLARISTNQGPQTPPTQAIWKKTLTSEKKALLGLDGTRRRQTDWPRVSHRNTHCVDHPA